MTFVVECHLMLVKMKRFSKKIRGDIMNILWGIAGIAVVLGIALAMSSDRKAIKWRTIIVGLGSTINFCVYRVKMGIWS